MYKHIARLFNNLPIHSQVTPHLYDPSRLPHPRQHRDIRQPANIFAG